MPFGQSQGAVAGHPLHVDQTSNGLITIATQHRRTHAGLLYTVGAVDQALADSASIDILIRTGPLQVAHMQFFGSVGGNCLGFLYEDPDIDADGVSIPAMNRNRVSQNVAQTTVFSGPTIGVGGPGTELIPVLIPGGSKTAGSGGSRETFNEFILDFNREYIARITNISGAVQPVSIEILWYEP